MAAFQRGIGLAEAQQNLESEHTGSVHMASPPMDQDHTASAHMEPEHTASAHMEPQTMTQTGHIDLRPLMDPAYSEPASGSAPLLPISPLDAPRTDVTATTPPPSMDVPPMDPHHIAEARPASARGIDHPTRHDGSAPAG